MRGHTPVNDARRQLECSNMASVSGGSTPGFIIVHPFNKSTVLKLQPRRLHEHSFFLSVGYSQAWNLLLPLTFLLFLQPPRYPMRSWIASSSGECSNNIIVTSFIDQMIGGRQERSKWPSVKKDFSGELREAVSRLSSPLTSPQTVFLLPPTKASISEEYRRACRGI